MQNFGQAGRGGRWTPPFPSDSVGPLLITYAQVHLDDPRKRSRRAQGQLACEFKCQDQGESRGNFEIQNFTVLPWLSI